MDSKQTSLGSDSEDSNITPKIADISSRFESRKPESQNSRSESPSQSNPANYFPSGFVNLPQVHQFKQTFSNLRNSHFVQNKTNMAGNYPNKHSIFQGLGSEREDPRRRPTSHESYNPDQGAFQRVSASFHNQFWKPNPVTGLGFTTNESFHQPQSTMVCQPFPYFPNYSHQSNSHDMCFPISHQGSRNSLDERPWNPDLLPNDMRSFPHYFSDRQSNRFSPYFSKPREIYEYAQNQKDHYFTPRWSSKTSESN